MAKTKTDRDQPRQRIFKLFVNDEVARNLRIAAAIFDESPGDFARRVVEEAISKTLAGTSIPGISTSKPKRS